MLQPNRHFAVSKDEWSTKENTGQSLKNALKYCGMTKSTSRSKMTLNSEKIKPVALAVNELLCFSEGISESIIYILSQWKVVLDISCILGQSKGLCGASLA